jgi:hypothetical protein
MRFIILLLISSLAQADNLFMDGAVGVGNSDGTRAVSGGIQEDLYGPLKQRALGGFWIDNTGNGKTSSLFLSGQLGFQVNSGGTIAGIFSGPGLVSGTDALLGSYFEFVSDAHFGIQDKDLNYIGAYYRHISDAGITTVNIGRDMIGLELRF